MKYLWISAFVGLVLLADYLAGLAPRTMLQLGFIVVPLGTPLIGVALALRDTIQRRYGQGVSRRAIYAAGVASVLFAAVGGTPWSIIGASAAAFFISEFIDLLVYTVVHPKTQTARIALSCLASTPFDSGIFVWLAFGWAWPVVLGQTFVKLLGVLVYLLFRLVVGIFHKEAPCYSTPQKTTTG